MIVIDLTYYHFGNTIIHLGPAEDVNEAALKEIGPINFITGTPNEDRPGHRRVTFTETVTYGYTFKSSQRIFELDIPPYSEF